MNYLEAVILGLLQGLTEFLPVSSSGHLVIAQYFFGIEQPGITLEVMVHLGTLLSIIWVFRADLIALVNGFIAQSEERRLLVLLIMGIIPTGFMGIIGKPFFTGIFDSPLMAGFMLLITGFIVLAISMININVKKIKDMGISDALVIGIFQGIAIIPGISRSGSTILGALWRGLERETAVRYSFLLAIPAIAGAALIESQDILDNIGSIALAGPNILAMLTAFVSGIFAIKIFVNLLNRGKFNYIAYYCWIMGTLTVLFSMARVV